MLPPYLEDNLFLLCPVDQLVLRIVRVAVRVRAYCLSSLAAGTVQDAQKSSQSPHFICLSHMCQGSMVYSHQVPGTWPLFKPVM